MDKYNFNIRAKVEELLPPERRHPWFVAIVFSFCKPIRDMLSSFLSWAFQKKEELEWNGQTMVLRELLVRRFGPGIWIQNVPLVEMPLVLYPEHDAANPVLYPESNSLNPVLYPEGTLNIDDAYNFIVWVPDTLIFDEDWMRALLDNYKMTSADYIIQTYTL